MERAKVLFGCYRRGDANDPDQYIASIAAVLTLYEPDLIREVTDPRSGISTTEKFTAFMPNSGELKAYCDGIRDRRYRIARMGPPRSANQPPRPLDNRPRHRANIFVHPEAPQYAALIEAAKTADPADWRLDEAGRAGIWVALSLFEWV